MSDKGRVTMPSSGAGITRYFEDYKSKIEFRPEHIIVLTVLVIIVVWLLHVYGPKLLGF